VFPFQNGFVLSRQQTDLARLQVGPLTLVAMQSRTPAFANLDAAYLCWSVAGFAPVWQG
jgi:hypothetical protein